MADGWVGKRVRNKDGRTGKIQAETGFGSVLTLQICVDGEGLAEVVLRAESQDGGESGWEWWCENFEGSPRWLTLGDHN